MSKTNVNPTASCDDEVLVTFWDGKSVRKPFLSISEKPKDNLVGNKVNVQVGFDEPTSCSNDYVHRDRRRLLSVDTETFDKQVSDATSK